MLAFDVAAVDPDPAVGALEPDAVALAVLVDDAAEDVVVLGGLDDVLHAVGVGEGDFVFADGGVAAGDRLRPATLPSTAAGPSRPMAQRAMSLWCAPQSVMVPPE